MNFDELTRCGDALDFAYKARPLEAAWTIVRWHRPGGGPLAFCGALSRMSEYGRSLGFPRRGYAGNIVVFDTEEGAKAALDRAEDVATPLHEVHFFVRTYNSYNGESLTVYDGGELRAATTIYTLARGLVADRDDAAQWSVMLDSRPAASGCRMPMLTATAAADAAFEEAP